MLYDLSDGTLTPVSSTTFKAAAILERQHLQAAIRDRIDVLGDDLLVVAEEFGEFEDAHRRIDLLCVDRDARLVVVELKRTDDGGHMELQALRYAAMVSVMTFDDLAETYAKHRAATDGLEHDVEDASSALVEWFDEVDGDQPLIRREVRIILASANFSPEITTTVLWLNEIYSLDIRCVRLSPYQHDGRLLLDVQQVIPLPEAAELTVRLKKRQAAVKAAESNKDYTKFVISDSDGVTVPLTKRHAMLAMVQAVRRHGVDCKSIAAVLPAVKFRMIDGEVTGDDVWPALVAAHGLNPAQGARWHLKAPIHEDGRTWVLNNNWGRGTARHLLTLSNLTNGAVKAEAQPTTDARGRGQTTSPAFE